MTLSSTTLALPKTLSWPLRIGAFTQKERILSEAPIFWGKVHPPPWSPWSPPPPSTLTLAPGVHPPSTLESQSPSTLHPGALESTLHPGVHSISWMNRANVPNLHELHEGKQGGEFLPQRIPAKVVVSNGLKTTNRQGYRVIPNRFPYER